MTSTNRPAKPLLAGIAAAAILLLAGCAAGAGAGAGAGADEATGEPAPAPTVMATPDDSFGCGIGVSSTSPVLGETLRISRAPAPECLSLRPGSTHTLWLEGAGYPNETLFSEKVVVTVAGDGSFATSVTVPQVMPVGQATLRVEPTDAGYCASIGSLECMLPALWLTVGFDEHDLRPVTVVRADVATPTLPNVDAHLERVGAPPPFAAAGPGDGQLTLVIWGSGCTTLPGSYVASAPADTLAIVSETEHNTCNAPLVPWTTVIELPPERADPRVITVDNVEAVQFDLGSAD